jgi:hypothetical protein
MMVKGTEDSHPVTESTILYIDQKEAEQGEIDAALSFDVYPSSIQDSVIIIYGADLQEVVAVVDANYVPGDVNGDGKFNSTDAILVLQQSVDLITLSDDAKLAADVNEDGKINSSDAILILQFSVGLISEFPKG